MAIVLDEHARREVARRGERGRGAALLVCVEWMGVCAYLSVRWAPRRRRRFDLTARLVDGVVVWVDERVAGYARNHNITLSTRRLGPLIRPVVADEPLAMYRLEEWEWRRWVAERSTQGGRMEREKAL